MKTKRCEAKLQCNVFILEVRYQIKFCIFHLKYSPHSEMGGIVEQEAHN